jgi:transcriptional regulator with XRE-family HTH domain
MKNLSSKILRELRLEKELNQRQVAEHLGIPTNTYNHYELNNRQIPDDIKIRLAEFYDVSLDYLITGKERDYEYREPVKSEIERLYEHLTNDEKKYIKGQIIGLLKSHGNPQTEILLKTINY